MRGIASNGDLMVVGRAVNGWSTTPWTGDVAADHIRRAEIIRELLESIATSKECPMHWVNKAWGNVTKGAWNAKTSPFWRLIYLVSQSMLGASEQWPSRLIWSNLYKVAPFEGGNPGNRMCAAQQQMCEAHLAKEVEIWNPRRILFITGWNWAEPFIRRLGQAVGNQRAEWVEWSGVVETPNVKAQVVVSIRPEGRQDAALADLILEAFAKLEAQLAAKSSLTEKRNPYLFHVSEAPTP